MDAKPERIRHNSSSLKTSLFLFLCSVLVYALFSYWGIRSPDSEIVFRTAESLGTDGKFAISEDLVWRGFGLARGSDGKQYSIFGPGESVAAVPFYKIAEFMSNMAWYKQVPLPVSISHYVGNSLFFYATNAPIENLRPHAVRMVVSGFNVLVSALAVVVFFLIILIFTESEKSALVTSILFAFGTLIFPYSGTFFSEPLALLFVLGAFCPLILLMKKETGQKTFYYLFFSGLFLGLATLTHLSAILFTPFFFGYAIYQVWKQGNSGYKTTALTGLAFCVGIGIWLAVLAYYNYTRFGNILETGRTVDPAQNFGYGVFVAPWYGLYGLLFSSGKSFLFYCPLIILSLAVWKYFHARYRALSFTILSASLFRILFIASRSDWHGGFSLGPRYMILLIPFLLVPVAEWIKKILAEENTEAFWSLAGVAFLCVAQQIYFSLGEVFTFLHNVKWQAEQMGVNIFEKNLIYFDWNVTPLFYLLNGKRGPLFLSVIPVDDYSLWLILVLLTGILLFLFFKSVNQHSPGNKNLPQKLNVFNDTILSE